MLDEGGHSVAPRAALSVEKVDPSRVDGKLQGCTGAGGGLGVDARREQGALHLDESVLVLIVVVHVGNLNGRCRDREHDVGVGTELLHDLNLNVESRQRWVGEGRILEGLRP